MASYDSPGYQNAMPGIGARDTWQTAPGSLSPGAMPDTDSAGMGPEAGTVGNSAFIVPNFGSLVNGDRVTVSPLDTGVSSQADSYGSAPDPLTGIGAELGQTGSGMGKVSSPGNPTAGVGLDGVQP